MRLYGAFPLIALVTALLSPISAEAQTDVDCVAVHDTNDTRIGRWQGGGVHFEDQGVLVRLDVGAGGFGVSENLFYTEPACTGDEYMHEGDFGDFFARRRIIGSDVWHIDPADVGVEVPVESYRDASGSCNEGANLGDGVPALVFTLPTFTTPFHLEPEPCFTPPGPDPEQFINGCIAKNGTLKIVAGPADCTSRETPITLLGP